jgi:hypothetical protein
MTVHEGNVADFPADRILDPTLAAAQRAKALPESERRYPELPWAIYHAVMLLEVAKAACMSERRGSRQRARGMIDLAIKQLREAATANKVVARDDVGKAMREALGPHATANGTAAIQEMLSVLYYALAPPGDDGDDGGSAA